jgi:subtilisin family serine protease
MKIKSKYLEKIIILLLISLLGLTLVGCSSGSSGGEGSSEETVITSTAFDFLTPIYAALGTSSEKVISDYLPEEIEVELSDGSTKTVELAWETPDNYDSQTAGEYYFTGFYNISDLGTDEITVEVILTDKAVSISGNIITDYSFDYSSLSTLSDSDSTMQVNTTSLSSQSAEDNQLIIAFERNTAKNEREKLLKNNGASIKKHLNSLNAVLAEIPSDKAKFREALERSGMIRYIEPNYKMYVSESNVPNDRYYDKQWGLDMTALNYAWNEETGDNSIRIAVIDTGVDTNHPDLTRRIDTENAYNFTEDGMEDNHGHGTHVAGIIAALTDNNRGVAGVSWSGEILPIKALEDDGGGSNFSVADAILYAAGLHEDIDNPEPVDIINLSLGGGGYSELLEDAVNKAAEKGIILVAAAGNSNGSIDYPAAYENVIAVGAVNSSGNRASYSNTGSQLEVMAPGGDNSAGILSTYPDESGDLYKYMQGTSMAAPHIAGLTALLFSSEPELQKNNINTTEMIRERLQQAAVHPGTDEFSYELGYGLINANFALQNVNQIKVVLGSRSGENLDIEKEITLSNKGGSYIFGDIPPEEYSLIAWIDSNHDGIVNDGDYIQESEPINFKIGDVIEQDLTLQIN